MADGVNVGFEVFRIRTEIGERGATVKAGYDLPVRDKRTRAERYETLSEDFSYTPAQIDRSVLVPNQIRAVLETCRDTLFTELFPARTEVPKTLISPRTIITPRKSSASCARCSARDLGGIKATVASKGMPD